MVIWLIGISGSGKTTIGTRLFKILQETKNNWVFLDGDNLREVWGGELGHSISDREINAKTNISTLLSLRQTKHKRNSISAIHFSSLARLE